MSPFLARPALDIERRQAGRQVPGGRGGVFPDDLPDATPNDAPGKNAEREGKLRRQRRRTTQRASRNGHRPLSFQRNRRSLSLRRWDCAPRGPKHRHPKLFHAEIGHRRVPARVRPGGHRDYRCSNWLAFNAKRRRRLWLSAQILADEILHRGERVFRVY
jgi:hypothetical protein